MGVGEEEVRHHLEEGERVVRLHHLELVVREVHVEREEVHEEVHVERGVHVMLVVLLVVELLVLEVGLYIFCLIINILIITMCNNGDDVKSIRNNYDDNNNNYDVIIYI